MGGFKVSVIIRHMQAAVRRACARTSHNHVLSEQRAPFIARKLPLHRNEVLELLHGWLRTNAYWGPEGATHPGTSPMLTTEPTPICVVRGATTLSAFYTVVDSGLYFVFVLCFLFFRRLGI